MRPGAKVIFTFCGIFLAGGVCGGLVSWRICNTKKPDQFDRQKMQSFIKELDISEEQQKKIQPILEKTGLDLQQVRTESRKQTRALLEQMEADVAKELTDAQREKLKELQEKARERMRQLQLERERNRKPPSDQKPEHAPHGPPPPPGAPALPPPPAESAPKPPASSS